MLAARKIIGPIAVLVAALAVAGCVPKKKYTALETQLASDKATSEAQLAERDAKIGGLEETLTERDRTIAELEGKAAGLELERASLEEQLDALTREKAELVSDRSRLSASIDETRQALRDMMARKAAADARIAQFKDLVARFQALIDAGRVSVKIIDGRMVVGLATDVLFASGKADLSPEGEAAIREVAAVFVEVPNQRYQVEGHTDNVPINTPQFPSNWELASARSIRVVRALVDAGVDADRVSGASYGEHHPVGDNKSKDGRSSNRRIEITVVPDLSLLPGYDELNALRQ